MTGTHVKLVVSCLITCFPRDHCQIKFIQTSENSSCFVQTCMKKKKSN